MPQSARILPLLLVLSPMLALGSFQQAAYDSSPINYSRSRPADPIADLEARLAAGRAKLEYERAQGFLRELLKELDIPVSSQSLVFSKTSFQRQWINPRSPRALFFNDDVYVGFVQGGEVLEIASQDPQLGSIFYTVPQDGARPPRFQRQTDNCLQCHDSSGLTLGVPGVTVRSVFPGADGMPRFNLGGFRTSYRSPLEERWGGWYVTGTHGEMRHLGNAFFPDDPNPDLKPLRDRGANLTDLARRLELDAYPAETSDIVALMVLEYQTSVHNLITRANHETRVAVAQSDEINRTLGAPLRPLTEGSRRRIGYACEPLVEALVYSGEAPLTGRVTGTSTFAADFEKRGPFDRQGRSLRQFDLTKRMFKVPLSYLIYSKPFAGLPPEARDCVAGRLKEILWGRDARPEFSHLTPEDRRAMREIAIETLPMFAAAWK
ncbi:MAG: hypothetical protein HY293_12765 [Planctomycetes bacterium]|nr:hypothetical protein [Planctomycetota bacterium]